MNFWLCVPFRWVGVIRVEPMSSGVVISQYRLLRQFYFYPGSFYRCVTVIIDTLSTGEIWEETLWIRSLNFPNAILLDQNFFLINSHEPFQRVLSNDRLSSHFKDKELSRFTSFRMVFQPIPVTSTASSSFHFHMLRYTFTNNLLSNGAVPKDVQELRVTQCHYRDEHLRPRHKESQAYLCPTAR